MESIKTSCIINVEFYDLDPMNVVWHGNYIKFLEEARCDMLEKIGYTYDNMREDGSVYPVAKMDLKYIKPATFRQKLLVETTLLELEPAMIISYLIKDEKTGEKLFRAKSMQIRVDTKTGETIYFAHEKFLQKIKEYKK